MPVVVDVKCCEIVDFRLLKDVDCELLMMPPRRWTEEKYWSWILNDLNNYDPKHDLHYKES